MGDLKKIHTIIENSVPDYSSIKVVHRGTPYFPDVLMTGEMRFARRLGANFSVLNPDNQITLTQDASVQALSFSVSRILDGFEQNCLVAFGPSDVYTLEDWDPTYKKVFLGENLTANKPNGTKLFLWATPLVVHVDAPQGSTTLVVRSRYSLLNGDVLTYPESNFINSLTESQITLADTAGASLDPDFPFLYTLTLAQPLKLDMVATTTKIYLRSYPAYISRVLTVPKLTKGQMGPFVMDYVSSPLDSIQEYNEIFSVRLLDGGGSPLVGTLSALQTVAKNYSVPLRSIWSENMVFWDVKRGSGGYIDSNRYRLVTDEVGYARVRTRLIPEFPSGNSWTMKIFATSNGLLRLYSEPFGYQDYPITGFANQTITWSTPPGGFVKSLEILANLDAPGAEISVSDASLVGNIVQRFQYAYVFHVLGETNFQSTSVIIKPYFLSLSDLTARYNDGRTYDSGLIFR